jgi:hypothetical protein
MLTRISSWILAVALKRRRKEATVKTPDLPKVPIFCAHEHWGSIAALGKVTDAFPADRVCGARPQRRVHLPDILLDPYHGGWVYSAGDRVDQAAAEAGAESFEQLAHSRPGRALEAIAPILERQRATGGYQCIRRGLLFLYGVDISKAGREDINRLDRQIGDHYENIFHWYRQAMEKASFSHLIRPVHPAYYFEQSSPEAATEELSFTHSMIRIDPFLDFWKKDSPARDELARAVDTDPDGPASWREFLTRLFDVAAENGAAGIKQLQAYTRSLDFMPRPDDSSVRFRGDLDPDQVHTFQNWVMHECCKQAHQRRWPHQVHVGTHNLSESFPLPLGQLASQYGQMDIVQLHCWPFIEQAGWLAKHHANCYIDTCWQPVLSPRFFEKAMQTWLNYVPSHKFMCSQDSTSVEMAVGSALFVREILAEVLVEVTRNMGFSRGDLLRLARDILHNNAVEVYRIGSRIEE